jgi:hypothetical protein
MWQTWTRRIIPTFLFLSMISSAHAWDKGIYLTQYMLEKPEKLDYLIRESKAVGINTFIIDHEYFSSHYAPAIAKVKAAGIKTVTRIVVFSDGGNRKQIRSQAHWEEKLKFVDDAIKSGADVIQLDYIRYSSKEPADPQHAKDVYKIIKWFKEKINAKNVPMEIDIFGEVSYYPSMHIGQDIKMFADSVDGVNPMVYPSHFWPYQKYSAEPYKTINNSLNALVGQFNDKAPFKVHAFIEAANYHYIKKTSNAQKQKYLLEEIHAVEDAQNASGWYVWSANNVYDNLFLVLRNNKIKSADNEVTNHRPMEANAGDASTTGDKPGDSKTKTSDNSSDKPADMKTTTSENDSAAQPTDQKTDLSKNDRPQPPGSNRTVVADNDDDLAIPQESTDTTPTSDNIS